MSKKIDKNYVIIGNSVAGYAKIVLRVSAPNTCLLYLDKEADGYGELDKSQVAELIQILQGCLSDLG